MDFILKAIITLACSCGTLAFAADDQAAVQGRLKSQQDYYTRSLADIDKQHATSVAALLSKYRAAVDGLRAENQKVGELPGVIACKEEMDRLDKEGTPPGSDKLSKLPKLLKLQTIAVGASGTLEKETNKNILDLITNYVATLEGEKKRLTIAGQIEEAKAYDAEIGRVTNGARELAVARLVKEAATVDSPKPTDADPTKPGEVPLVSGGSECRIHTGPGPAPDPGVELKRQDLYGTRLGGKISRITTTAELGTEDGMETRKDSDGRSRTESGTLGNILRLTLGTQVKGESFKDAMVVVQYYGVDLGARGKVEPKEVDMESVMLKEISNQKVTIDFPAVSLRKYVYRYRSSYGSSHKSESGQEFHALMITIFDSKREIVYQTVSKQTMVEAGESVWAAVKKASQQSGVEAAKAAYNLARDEYFKAPGAEDREKRRQAYEEAREAYNKLIREQSRR